MRQYQHVVGGIKLVARNVTLVNRELQPCSPRVDQSCPQLTNRTARRRMTAAHECCERVASSGKLVAPRFLLDTGETLDRMSPSFAVGTGETTIALLELPERTEVEHSRRQLCRQEGWIGLVLKLKERNLSKRARLSEFAWGFPEECTGLGVNESNLTDSIFSAEVGAASEQRKWTTRPASSPGLG